jgi:uncharacterized protein
MDLTEQLKALGLRKGVETLAPQAVRGDFGIEALVPGEVVSTEWGECFVCRQRFPPEYEHGRTALGMLSERRRETLAHLAGDPAIAGVDLSRLIFLDLETTGLDGGTGTYAFLIGVGHFTADGAFCLEQFFMRDYGEEPAQLTLVSELLRQFDAVVTFNGKAFDMPLLGTRLALSHMPSPLVGAPHLDLLFPSRRLWSSSLPSCALSSLEASVLGMTRDVQDVPGFLIPSLYFDYLRTDDARPLSRVFYHNAHDILSMVTLANLLCEALEAPLDGQIPPAAMLGVARLYEETGRHEESVRVYCAALERRLSPEGELHALRRLSALYKRGGRRDEAAVLWHRMVDSLGQPPLDAFVELAMHYEWTVGDLSAAFELAERARHMVERWRPGPARRRETEALERRLRRLRRKLEGQMPADAGDAEL